MTEKELKECLVVWCGCIPYGRALQLQMKICELKKHGFDKDILLLLEHPAVITLGRSADRKNLLVQEEYLKARGIELFSTDRGGDITFHGPGQLVGYPVLALRQQERDVRKYMRNLEESLIRLLSLYGIPGSRNPDFTGVWTDSGKIAAMGVHISRWITRHGFALNVNTDLTFFEMIIPCGISGKGVVSMQKLARRTFDIKRVAGRYVAEFGAVFNRQMVAIGEYELEKELKQYKAARKTTVR